MGIEVLSACIATWTETNTFICIEALVIAFRKQDSEIHSVTLLTSVEKHQELIWSSTLNVSTKNVLWLVSSMWNVQHHKNNVSVHLAKALSSWGIIQHKSFIFPAISPFTTWRTSENSKPQAACIKCTSMMKSS